MRLSNGSILTWNLAAQINAHVRFNEVHVRISKLPAHSKNRHVSSVSSPQQQKVFPMADSKKLLRALFMPLHGCTARLSHAHTIHRSAFTSRCGCKRRGKRSSAHKKKTLWSAPIVRHKQTQLDPRGEGDWETGAKERIQQRERVVIAT